MRVSELARAGGVTAETVRYYTREGLLPSRRDSHNGYQLYDDEVLGRLRLIDCLRCLGLSLKEIKRILEREEQGCGSLLDLDPRLVEKLPLLHSRIRELQALASWVEQAGRPPSPHCYGAEAPCLKQLMAELARQHGRSIEHAPQ
ncbi:MerR family transcriptional regulator [Billgrantia desiderata]|uniref:MerR family transcriptional regulator n=1 Tax=Billgrantia desiderata TaxID=52021 RepID=UPI001F353FE4|nr:MerR family transcriptional regulator [Halomonas desiderata]MCE8012100.1 MerR family transcriptional regulator [Halomonas desiderata]